MKRMLRCPDMDNRMYSRQDGGSLRWVLLRQITIKNFTTRQLTQGKTELHYACRDNEAWIARACVAFNDAADINAPDDDEGDTALHVCRSGVDLVYF